MDKRVFDYRIEYETYMTPESQNALHQSDLYQQYYIEKARLAELLAARLAAKQALTDSALLSEVQEFELLSKMLLRYAQELDPYGVE